MRIVAAACLVLLSLGCGRPAERLVLYCAQDRPFAEGILSGFEKASHVTVDAKYDTEANKSVGLFRELQLEVARPRCDVHWNNEILTTLMLAKMGVLESYASPSAADYPDHAKAPDKTWTAFGARARVLIANKNLIRGADLPTRLLDLASPRWTGKIAMAKPLHGTTATQAVCLAEVLGVEPAKNFYRALKNNGVKIYPGNKQVAEAVGRGDAAIGLTDTDDAIEEVLAGKPVAILFPDSAGGTPEHPRMGTLFIPNTVALVRGGPNPAAGRRLIDFLLSPEVERRLATGGGYQIPLNPKVQAELPAALAPAREAARMQVDFTKAAALWDEVLAFLRGEFAR
ncbi:MAG: extracellular solute-binding protein [Gemmataceae bacterium]|nr:extracellular solute-binding protein [Gemmataceae bacterium]